MNGCILLLTAVLSVLDPEGPHKTFQLGPDGQWVPVAPTTAMSPPAKTASGTPSTTAPTAETQVDPEIVRLTALLRANQFAEAREDGIIWLKANPFSVDYDRGLYIVAQAMRGTRQYVRAFYYCDQLCDEHGDSPLYEPAIQLQYEIADAYLLGVKDRLLGMRIVGRQDEAVEMLFRIQQRAPGSPVAEKSLLRTADYYWANGDFDLASDAYHSYVQSYPRSPLVPQARLREAYSNLAQFHGPSFDSTPILNAKTLLGQIQGDYPDLAKQESIPEKLQLADRQLARKLYIDADFYRRTGKPTASVVLCKRLIKQYPNAPEASDAQAMLARLEPKHP